MRPVALVALAACSSAPAATTDFFGPTIEPPRGLMWIQPGMSADEAKRIVPGLHDPDRKGVRDELILDSNVSDVTLTVRLDNGTVSGIVAVVQGHGARDLLTRAWGPPQIAHDSLGQPEVTWASESTGWKVKLDCLERNCQVEYLPYKVLTAEFFGSHVIPPGDLGKLRIGMKLGEARAIVPGIIASRSGVPTSVDGVREFVQIDDNRSVVRSIYLNLPPHAEDLIAEAWSEGWKATELGRTVLVWPDPTTGWRATLRDALGYSHDLAYDNFMPAAHLLGDQPDAIDALPQPVLGKSVDDVKKAYKDQLAPGKDLALLLPPTEWERATTRVQLRVSDGKIRSIAFNLPYKPRPEARETLLELFKKKWGDPKEADEKLVFHDEDPRVEIRDDTEHGAWQVELR
ncbi:MAG TPA: hypothetical protein VGC41_09865 [Kofleriaceae bacterium]